MANEDEAATAVEPAAAELPQPEDPEAHERERAEREVAAAAAERDPRARRVLPDEIEQMLREPLDERRVKQRRGRGSAKFDYLETHDVVRAANRIFGFGGWGHEIVTQELIGQVQVEKRRGGGSGGSEYGDSDPGEGGGTKGWHVAYRCVVRLTVAGCVPVSGSGYGDGVEYGPAALVTAQELALKESESDALKRALKNFGDQFGLILYAKTDDRARLERDQAADVSRAVTGAPVTMKEIIASLERFVLEAQPWVKEAVDQFYEGANAFEEPLPTSTRLDAIRRLQQVVVQLDALIDFDPVTEPAATQTRVRAAFAAAFEGLVVSGPEPFEPCLPF